MSKRDQLESEIAGRLGIYPSFYQVGENQPEIVTNLWEQTLFAYLDNPIPDGFKERLFVYLSRFCKVPYCVTRHATWLVTRDDPHLGADIDGENRARISVFEMVEMLNRPALDQEELQSHLEVLRGVGEPLGEWPRNGSIIEESVFACSTSVFLSDSSALDCRIALRDAFRSDWYERLVLFLSFVRTAHFWTETHDNLQLEPDVESVLSDYPPFAEWVSSYNQQVEREQQQQQRKERELYEQKQRNYFRDLATKRLVKQEKKFRTLADNVPELFCYVDTKLRCQFVNRRYEEVFGRPRQQMLGRPIIDVVGNDDYLRMIQEPLQTALAGNRVSFVDKFRVYDGTDFWFTAVLIPDQNEQGQVSGVYFLATDITERRALEKQVLDVAAEESRRIGNDLHDGIGQALTGLSMVADTLVTAMSRREAAPELRFAKKLDAGLKQTLGQVRVLARGMYPVDVDAAGLMSALSLMCEQITDLYNIDCSFECNEPVLLADNQVATQVFRIAQEATTNAVKHGKAKRIEVVLLIENNCPRLRVIDDGVGIVENPQQSHGMGLRIMGYRAGIAGAELRIRPATGGGTEVSCTLARENNR
ncbi:Sensor histidine kinase LiaS [Planctomycetes bacterium CA13]|uniref:Sensor histidine kinase LiaS n=1 Tax=Novipirellula herctigrandis TaxID=2527986 RepID=A0A5C5YNI6_9BACT|nr:Sensor histidine kinase LiaS [Planctomycetes bacterium CA13]